MRQKLILLIFLLFTFTLKAQQQDVDAHSPHPSNGSPQQRNADKKKIEQQKKIEKGNEGGRERHVKLQTRNTRRMMRKSKKASEHWNSGRK